MSLFVNDTLKAVKKDTKEYLTNQLLIPTNVYTATRIHKVVAFSVYNLLTLHFSNKQGQMVLLKIPESARANKKIRLGDYFKFLGERVQINAVSEDGKSRNEAVTAMGGLISEDAKQQKVLTSFFN